MPKRIPHPECKTEVRKAFQELTFYTDVLVAGASGQLLVGVAVGSQPVWVNKSAIDHGAWGGLTDDDHTQYHNDTRGDARYYTETELNAGQLDNRYFRENEHLNVSAGATDAGKPIKLDSGGHVDATMINDGDIDHGLTTGRGDDDHTQYHNDARGDARYYTETELNAGQLDNRYFRENEHLNVSAGASDAGKPIKLDAGGHVDATMINDGDIDHGSTTGLTDDDHTQYHNDTRGDARYYRENEHINVSTGVSDAGKPIVLDAGGQVDATMINDGDVDHGSVGGLTDDDHTQYHNDTRGDARYYTETELNAGQLDSRYFTETEHIDVSTGISDAGKPIKLDSGGKIDGSMLDSGDVHHGGLAELGDDDHPQYHNDTRGDARYYRENEFISTSAGATDAGKPIVLDAGGQVDATMVNDGDIDHGLITGLTDDDHSQYHNDTRGDARYYRENEFISTSAGATDAGKPIVLDADGQVDATMINDADVDHGSIGGLTDDDHTQYHNDSRGDARYYTETELNAGQLDGRYFTETEHIATSAGATDAGKPIVLDAGGQVDATMINDADVDHGSVGGLTDDDHTQYHNDSRGDARYYRENEFINVSTGVADAGKPIVLDAGGQIDATMINDGDVDHGSIGGLTDDDHTQYHNDTRGDARYYTETELNAGQLDGRYFTETEHIDVSTGASDAGKPIKLDVGGQVDASMVNDGDIDHGSVGGLADDDHTQYLRADGTRALAGNLSVGGGITIDGRDLSADGTKLDGVEAGADVTDAGNVTAAGAAMAGGAFHDGFSDFVAAEHVSLPNSIASVLSDHDLAAHTALGLFDASGDVDHDATANYVAAKHLSHPNTLANTLTDHTAAAHVTLGFQEVITSNVTYYIATTGNDTTGDGTSGNPWLTLARAYEHIAEHRYASDVTVTIQFADGTYNYTSYLTFALSDSVTIVIQGENTYTKTLSSIVSSSGSSGAWSLVLQLDSSANIAVNDLIIILTASGGTKPLLACGCHKVTAVNGGNQITVTSKSKSANVPAGAVTATVYVLKSILNRVAGTSLTFKTTGSITFKNIGLSCYVYNGDIFGNATGVQLCALFDKVGAYNGQIALTNASWGQVLSGGFAISGGKYCLRTVLGGFWYLDGGAGLWVVSGGTAAGVRSSFRSFLYLNAGLVTGNATGILCEFGAYVYSSNNNYFENTTHTSPAINTEGSYDEFIASVADTFA